MATFHLISLVMDSKVIFWSRKSQGIFLFSSLEATNTRQVSIY